MKFAVFGSGAVTLQTYRSFLSKISMEVEERIRWSVIWVLSNQISKRLKILTDESDMQNYIKNPSETLGAGSI